MVDKVEVTLEAPLGATDRDHCDDRVGCYPSTWLHGPSLKSISFLFYITEYYLLSKTLDHRHDFNETCSLSNEHFCTAGFSCVVIIFCYYCKEVFNLISDHKKRISFKI